MWLEAQGGDLINLHVVRLIQAERASSFVDDVWCVKAYFATPTSDDIEPAAGYEVITGGLTERAAHETVSSLAMHLGAVSVSQSRLAVVPCVAGLQSGASVPPARTKQWMTIGDLLAHIGGERLADPECLHAPLMVALPPDAFNVVPVIAFEDDDEGCLQFHVAPGAPSTFPQEVDHARD